MTTVGIIGPLTPRGSGNHAVSFLQNVAAGLAMATALIRHGYAPFCPHLDMQYVLADPMISETQLKAVSMEWVGRCDVIIALDGWRESTGAMAEYALACGKNIPVVFSIKELVNGASRLVG
jgi:nucleoside 2-deoxyribosyltransferase